MKLRQKLSTACRMSWRKRAMVAEAALLLGLARLAVLVLPARWFLPRPTQQVASGALPDQACCTAVRWAIAVAARNVPWRAVCLPQALAARAMLARRGQRSTFHLGARPDPSRKLVGHAWLTVGDTVITGGDGMAGVKPLAKFS